MDTTALAFATAAVANPWIGLLYLAATFGVPAVTHALENGKNKTEPSLDEWLKLVDKIDSIKLAARKPD